METEAPLDETVYGTNESDGHVMSERVQSLASSIYKEFEHMIKKYDEDVVKELMPLVVGILEALDLSFADKQEDEVELELLRDDNEQLLTQYEREKQLRKAAEQKILEIEDTVEEERKQTEAKLESLESIVRMLELKGKNATDHVGRLEEKESEMKKEYNKLHERYTELFKTHMDYLERSKLLMGSDRMDMMGISPRGRGLVLPILRPAFPQQALLLHGETPKAMTPVILNSTPVNSLPDNAVNLQHELKDSQNNEINRANLSAGAERMDRGQTTDSVEVCESGTGTGTSATVTAAAIVADGTHALAPASALIPAETGSSYHRTDRRQDTLPVTENSFRFESDVRFSDDPIDGDNNDYDLTISNRHVKSAMQNIDRSDYIRRLVAGENLPATGTLTEADLRQTMIDIVESTPELEDFDDNNFGGGGDIAGARSRRGDHESIYDEMIYQGPDVIGEMDEGADITDDMDDASDNFFGMGKEVENLIQENAELLATKNALNIVKDDLIAKVDELTSEHEILREEIKSIQTLKEKFRQRVTELEDDMKKQREDLEKKSKPAEGDEEDVPMAMRKRFTRVEMARVLMERNQYKERLMELQEAVRWTEMIRASREHPELVSGQKPKNRSSIWNFFSNLFTSSDKPRKRPMPHASIRYSAPTLQVQPVGDPNKRHRAKYNLGEKAKAYDFLQDELLSEKTKKERERERKEQYKQVRAHVKKDDGRMQAYGWSLPAKIHTSLAPKDGAAARSTIPVPVPVYCRPLLERDPGMKLWCAAGVNLSGGRTKDGGSIVGASIFYSGGERKVKMGAIADEVEKLDQEIKDHEKDVRAVTEDQHLSSLVWIVTSTHSSSHVTVIDANNPSDSLESFHVTSSHILCIASVNGATETDYPTGPSDLPRAEPARASPAHSPEHPRHSPGALASPSLSPASHEMSPEQSGIGGITFVQCATGRADTDSPLGSPDKHDGDGEDGGHLDAGAASSSSELPAEVTSDSLVDNEGDPLGAVAEENIKITRATGSPATSSGPGTPVHTERRTSVNSELVKDGIAALPMENEFMYVEVEKMNSVLPTMWLGSQRGNIYVHSAVSQWKRCLHSVKLRDSVLSIVHVKGRVLAALADGTVAAFHRADDGQWDLTNYHLLDLGRPHHSIRCMVAIANRHVWCGYRNRIHVVNPKTLLVEKSFDAHPRKESQVRQLAWVGDGVWVSIRLDSTLRLYHAYTYDHLQDVDIEPYVSKMLGTGKLGFSFVRITSLLVSSSRLWIGTGNGVIISVPLSENNKKPMSGGTGRSPGGVIRVYNDTKTDAITPGSFLPYCSMAQAQLSFHGHKDAVKFFAAVPGSEFNVYEEVDKGKPVRGSTSGNCHGDLNLKVGKPQLATTMLVISGGEGYVDFRIGDGDADEDEASVRDDERRAGLSRGDKSHLIVWEVSATS